MYTKGVHTQYSLTILLLCNHLIKILLRLIVVLLLCFLKIFQKHFLLSYLNMLIYYTKNIYNLVLTDTFIIAAWRNILLWNTCFLHVPPSKRNFKYKHYSITLCSVFGHLLPFLLQINCFNFFNVFILHTFISLLHVCVCMLTLTICHGNDYMHLFPLWQIIHYN